jgi:hypothetical protein
MRRIRDHVEPRKASLCCKGVRNTHANVKVCPFCGAQKPKTKKNANEKKDGKEKRDKDTDIMTIYAEYIVRSNDGDEDSKKKEIKDVRLLKPKEGQLSADDPNNIRDLPPASPTTSQTLHSLHIRCFCHGKVAPLL